MIVSNLVRAARGPTAQSLRRYATEAGPSSSGSSSSSNAVYGAIGATVAGLGYYYYSQGNPNKDLEKVKSMASQQAQKVGKSAFTGGDQGWVDLKLDSVENYNHNTKKFRFALPESDDVSGLQVASAILTKYKDSDTGKPVIRPYTPVSDEDTRGFLDLLIKVYPNGPMSNHMHDMVPEQRLEFKGPIPKYPWEANKHPQIALIAGGTGITPMYQLARAIFNNPSDKTKVTLIFGNLTQEDILLKEEFEHLENTYPQRFRAFYLLDEPPKGWPTPPGHVTKELLKTVLPEPKEENIKIFVCGPPGLYKAVSGTKNSPSDQGELTGMLKELGYSGEQVYKF